MDPSGAYVVFCRPVGSAQAGDDGAAPVFPVFPVSRTASRSRGALSILLAKSGAVWYDDSEEIFRMRGDRMKVNVKKLAPAAKLPAYGSAHAAGADLFACEAAEIPAGETRFVRTGIAVELPAGTVGLIYARSGLACKQDLAPANKVGVIDCDYRGEIIVALHNHGRALRTIAAGDRIAQLVIAPCYTGEFTETDELSATVRGAGGFGSTGMR